MKTLQCARNSLSALPLLPASLTSVDCGHNRLKALPELNLPHLWRLGLANNALERVGPLDLPELWRLDLSNNALSELPPLKLPRHTPPTNGGAVGRRLLVRKTS